MINLIDWLKYSNFSLNYDFAYSAAFSISVAILAVFMGYVKVKNQQDITAIHVSMLCKYLVVLLFISSSFGLLFYMAVKKVDLSMENDCILFNSFLVTISLTILTFLIIVIQDLIKTYSDQNSSLRNLVFPLTPVEPLENPKK